MFSSLSLNTLRVSAENMENSEEVQNVVETSKQVETLSDGVVIDLSEEKINPKEGVKEPNAIPVEGSAEDPNKPMYRAARGWVENQNPMVWKWVPSATDSYALGYGYVAWDYGSNVYSYDWLKIVAAGGDGTNRKFDIYVATTASPNYESYMGSKPLWKFHNHINVDGVEVADVAPTYPGGVRPSTGGNINNIPSWAWVKATTVNFSMGTTHTIDRVTWNTDTYTKSYLTATISIPYTYVNVTFKEWDGTVLKTEKLKYGGSATAPSVNGKTGWSFTGWDRGYSNVTEDIVVNAQYKINQYSVYFDGNGGTSSFGSITKYYDEALGTLPSASRTGYTFKGWWSSPTGGSQITSSTRMPATGPTYYAHWEINKYTITTSVINGTITPTDIGVIYNTDKTVSYSPADSSKYVLDSVTVDGNKVNINTYPSSYTFSKVSSNHSINVVYRRVYNITTSKSGNGSGTITGNQLKLEKGTTKTINYSADSNSYIKSVKVDGVSIDLKKYPNSYTFSNISDDHTVSVVFEKKPTIIITKNISNISDVVLDKGHAIGLFKIEGTDYLGRTQKFYRSIWFTDLSSSSKSVTVNIPAGRYTVSEVSINDWEQTKVESLTSSTVEGKNVVVDTRNSDSSSVRFTNGVSDYSEFTGNDIMVNVLK